MLPVLYSIGLAMDLRNGYPNQYISIAIDSIELRMLEIIITVKNIIGLTVILV
jgi:hypothetical protein